MNASIHQYIERGSGAVRTEKLLGDSLVSFLYAPVREKAPALFRALTSAWASDTLALLNYDLALGARLSGKEKFLEACGIDLSECLDPPQSLDTPRKVFERRIRYWECRPMPEDPSAVVSPADARVLVGSFAETSSLEVKGKFFDFEELLGRDRIRWCSAFAGGDFAVFRLTPDKYHYNHVPVSGRVMDIYEIPGGYHSCNPGAVVREVTPFSKNRRVVTVIDTDVPGGTGVGLVAMIEVVALMIGEVVQCYCEGGYERPRPVVPGLFLKRGFPKSLYRPGSSTDILVFQSGRVRFAADLVQNRERRDAVSRFTLGFTRPLVETEVQVRSLLALPAPGPAHRNVLEVSP